MAEAVAPDEQHNFETFRDCFSEPVLKALSKPTDKPKKKKRVARKSKDGKNGIVKKEVKTEASQTVSTEEDQASAEDLGEFIDVSQNRLSQNAKLTTHPVPLHPHISRPPAPPPHPFLFQVPRQSPGPGPLLEPPSHIHRNQLGQSNPPASP